MTTANRQARNAMVLQIIAAARRIGRDDDASKFFLGDLPVEPVQAVAAAIWITRYCAGRAGCNDDLTIDDPRLTARTLREFRSGVEYNLSRDPDVARNRAVLLKIVDLVAATTPDTLPPRESLSELLVTAAAQDAQFIPVRLALWRITELIAALAELDSFPGRLLDVLAADFMTTHNEGDLDAVH